MPTRYFKVVIALLICPTLLRYDSVIDDGTAISLISKIPYML